MANTITFDTYPDMFTDYSSLIENELYDTEKRNFTVPTAWAIDWVYIEFRMSMQDFLGEYTWDDTYQMYMAAVKQNVLIKEETEER